MAAPGGGILDVALSGAGYGGSLLAGTGGVRAPEELFSSIFIVFVVLGTLVGVVVISYILYNAYKYRYREEKDPAPEVERPQMGELPEGGGKGKKLFLSFGMSAIIVLSLILWTYGALQFYENKPEQIEQGGGEEVLDVNVTGYQFGWEFTYPNNETVGTLRVPTDKVVRLHVTSRDVFHNFGVPELRVKSDAIPGQTTTAWFTADKTGTYVAQCYELCGVGHSQMQAQVKVMKPAAYQEWYSGLNTTGNGTKAARSDP